MSVPTRSHLGTLLGVGSLGQLGDAQLLELFLHGQDAAEVAFTVLVERHGPTVLRACRSVLLDPNDAHDAFQATFLTLVRKANSVRNRQSVGSWLIGVALRLSRRLRVDAARRRDRERAGASRKAVHANGREADGCQELLEEIAGLPEVFRAPVELCYLRGVSTEEAARRLGCPRGTVLSRLARARERLRERLVRRGIALGVAPALDGLAGAAPLVPEALLARTVAAAMSALSGRGGGLAWCAARRLVPLAVGLLGVAASVDLSRPPLPSTEAPGSIATPARAGLLDPSFGDAGTIPIRLPAELTELPPALAVQPDGKVLVLTSIGTIVDSPHKYVLARYRADGRLDAGFGEGGTVTARFPHGAVGEPASRPRVAVQADGKVVVAAFASIPPLGIGDFGVQRFRADGSVDAGFGRGGAVVFNVGIPAPGGGRAAAGDDPSGLAIQPDGKILVGGTSGGFAPTGEAFVLARLLPDGSLDEEFGQGGLVATEFPSGHTDTMPRYRAHASDLALGPGGRIALAGDFRPTAGWRNHLAVCVYDPSGRLDPTFGEGGRFVLDVADTGQDAEWFETGGMAFAPDGGLLIAGSVWDPALIGRRAALVRLDPAGRLIRAFGVRGIVRAGPGHAGRLVFQPDGQILLGGSADHIREPFSRLHPVAPTPEVSDFSLARFLPDGTPDSSFGVGGVVRSGLSDHDSIEGLALAPDGSILALGLGVWSREEKHGVVNVLTRHFGR